MRGFAVLLGLLAVGCVFDAEVPADVVVACSRDADCPAGMTCRREAGRCILPRGDADAPQFDGAPTLSHRHVMEGTRFTLAFRVTEELVRSPTVRLSATGATRALELVEAESRPAERTWVFAATAQRADGEGPASILVDMEDLVGNSVTGLLSGVVNLDFTPPTVASDQVTIQPGVVRPGTRVNVLALASEAVRPGVLLTARAGTVAEAFSPALADGASLTFQVLSQAFAAQAQVELEVSGLVDLAGNQAPPLRVGQFEIDTTGPVLSALDVSTPRGSLAAGYEVIRFSFTARDYDLLGATVGAMAASCTEDAGAFACEYRLDGGEPEGVTGLLVRAQDLAGNLSESRGSVVVDFTPPTVVPGSVALQLVPAAGNPLIRPEHAGPGTLVELSFALTEPTRAPAVDGGRLAWALASQAGTTWRFAAVVPDGGVDEGAVAVTALLEDETGNVGLELLAPPAPGLVVDTTSPSAPRADGGLLLRRVPYGADQTGGTPRTSLVVPPGSFEGTGTARVFAFGAPLSGELVRFPVGSSGGASEALVADFDVASPWLEFIDLAGNRSPAVPLDEQEWTVAFGRMNPLPGRRQELAGRFARAVYPATQAAALERADGVVEFVEGRGRWVNANNRGSLTLSSSLRLVFEGATGHLLALAPTVDTGTGEGNLGRWDGERWWLESWTDPELDGDPDLGNAVVVQGFELGIWAFTSGPAAYRWAGESWVATSVAGAPALTSAFVGVPGTGRILAFGLGGTVREFDGRGWALLTLDDPEGDGNPSGTMRAAASLLDGRVYVYVDKASDELWEWTGRGARRLATGFTFDPSLDFLVDPATGQPLLLFPTAAHRWTGAGWSAVTISDPELDGSPSQPFSSLPAVDWYAREVVAVSAGHTWRWTGASWALAHAPYGTDGPDNHFFPLAIPNPELRRLEVCGGGGYFGPIYSDCRAWNGHTWKLLDGGMPFPPNEYGGSVAVMPDGGVLVLTKGVDAGASVWRRSGGAWSSAPSFPAMVHNGQLAWEPGAQRFFSLQTSSDVTLGHALGGTGWTQLEQGSLDAGTLPHGSYSPYSLAADPITGGLVSTGTGSWLRGATWTRLTSDPEGDGEPQLACVTTSWERGRSYAVYRELFEFTGASWRRVPITRVVPSDGAFPGIFGCFLGMLPGTSRLVVSPYGNEVFEFDFAAAAAPAVELALPLSLGGFSSNASVQGAVLRARVGGQGLVAGATLPGARARAWSNGAWTPLGQTSAPAATPGWLEVDASAAVPRWGSTAPLRLQLTPLGVNGTGSASLALDYAELTVRLKR